MFTRHIADLVPGTQYALHIQVDPRNSLAPWRRVGTITPTAEALELRLDAAAAHVERIWSACTAGNGAGATPVVKVRFGVFTGRAGMLVIAEGGLTAAQLAAARRAEGSRPARRRGVPYGPRGTRCAWPDFAGEEDRIYLVISVRAPGGAGR